MAMMAMIASARVMCKPGAALPRMDSVSDEIYDGECVMGLLYFMNR